jgi:hypothetical protein
VPNRSLIFLTILAAAAVAFALVIVTGGGGSVQIGAPLLDRPIFSTIALEIEPADGAEPLRIERVGERWVIASDGWPANETAVRAALRLLGEIPISAGGASPSDRETRVTLEFEGGEKAEFWIEPAARAVGGGAAVRDAAGRQGRAPIDLARAFETAKADTWRSLAAMPTVEIESSRVTIERMGEPPIALARVRGRWFLREPARAKADDRAVAALIGDLIDLRAIRFDGEAAGQTTSGVTAIVVERDERVPASDGSVSTRVARSELQTLGPANADGSESAVVSDGVRLVMRTDRLEALNIDPSDLVSRSAIAAGPGDIGMIVLRGMSGEIAFRRKVSEWDALGEAATRLADPTEESGGVERLLSFLSNAQAETVAIDPDRAGVVTLDRFIQIFGLGDEPIATIGVGRTDSGGLVLFDESQPDVVRTYSAGQTPPLLRAWLEL